MSGRREAQVMADARMLGQRLLRVRGRLRGGDRGGRADPAHRRMGNRTDDEQHARRPGDQRGGGFRTCSSSAIPAAWSGIPPWHHERKLSLLMRGMVDVGGGQRAAARRGGAHEDLRFLDNGAIGRPHGGHRQPQPRLPPRARRGEQGGRGAPPTLVCAATTRNRASASAIRSRISRSAVSVGRFFLRRQRPRPRPAAARGAGAVSRTRPSPRAQWATASTRLSSRPLPSAVERATRRGRRVWAARHRAR